MDVGESSAGEGRTHHARGSSSDETMDAEFVDRLTDLLAASGWKELADLQAVSRVLSDLAAASPPLSKAGSGGSERPLSLLVQNIASLTESNRKLAVAYRLFAETLNLYRGIILRKSGADAGDLAELVVTSLAAEIFPLAYIAKVEADQNEIRMLARSGVASAYTNGLRLVCDAGDPDGQGPAGRCVRTRTPQVTRLDDPAFAKWRERASSFGLGGSLVTSAEAADGSVYLLSVYVGAGEEIPAPTVPVFEGLIELFTAVESRLQLERELDRQLHYRAIFSRLQHLPVDLFNFEGILSEAGSQISLHPEIAGVDLLLVEAGNGRFIRFGAFGDTAPAIGELPEPVLGGEFSVPGWVADAHTRQVFDRKGAGLRPVSWTRHRSLDEIDVVAAWPIAGRDGGVAAVIVLFSRTGGAFSQATVELLDRLFASVEIEIARADEREELRNLAAVYDALAGQSVHLAKASHAEEMYEVTLRALLDTELFRYVTLVRFDGRRQLPVATQGDLRGVATTVDLAALIQRAESSGNDTYISTIYASWPEANANPHETAAAVIMMRLRGGETLALASVSNRPRVIRPRMITLLERASAALGGALEALVLRHELVAERDRQAYQASHDVLTDLPNRRAFERRAQEMLEGGRRVAVGILDLDHFKEWNDSYRHQEGDELLKRIAASIASADADFFLARLGGDEFGILSEYRRAGLIMMSSRVLSAISDCSESYMRVTGSLGWAIQGEHGSAYADLFAHADEAMYEAKAAGGNTYQFYTPEIEIALTRAHQIRTEFDAAFGNGDLEYWYQPQFKWLDRRLHSVELLLRWRRHGEIVPAGEFIYTVEHDPRLARRLCGHSLEAAFALSHEYRKRKIDRRVSLNVSASAFLDKRFLVDLEAVARNYDYRDVCVEITETTAISDVALARSTILQLAALGIEVAMDDFGTGYSSLSYVAELPIAELKLDRSFLKGISRNSRSFAAIMSGLTVGHYSNLRVIGEGIDDEDDLATWITMGGDYVQGFILAEPLQDPFADLDLSLKALPGHLAPLNPQDIPLLAEVVRAREFGRHICLPDCRLATWIDSRANLYSGIGEFRTVASGHLRPEAGNRILAAMLESLCGQVLESQHGGT